MKRHGITLLTVLLALVIYVSANWTLTANAATVDDLTYEIKNGELTITDCNASASGELIIPDSIEGYPVTDIGAGAFYECSSLSSVTIPNGVTSIGQLAFYDCTNLTSVTIPNSVTSIGDLAFCFCDGLTSMTLPDGVTSIGNFVFSGCDNLISVKIPHSVTSIGDEAFKACSSLTGIWVNENNAYYSSDANGVLFNKEKSILIKVPCAISGSYVIPDSVKNVGSSAFSWCSRLLAVTIPNSVSTIEGAAFLYCASLISMDIPDSVTIIGEGAFAGCENLTSVTLGNNVTSIGQSMFAHCPCLTSVKIPDKVTSIGESAFFRCFGLTSVTIPDSVTSIGRDAFAYCDSLTDVYYTGTQDQWNQIDINVDRNESLLDAAFHYYVLMQIHSQPKAQNLLTGKNAVFTVSAEGTGLKYQWQYRTSAKGSWKNASATGNKTATLSVPATAARNGYQYRCKITDKNGNVLYSSVATLRIVTLKVKAQPASKYLPAGKTAKFTVKVSGTGLKYQWQYRTSAKGSWKNASATGNKTATVSVPATASRNGYQYRCKITDKYGNVIYSNAATLKIVTLKITTQPSSVTLAKGKTATFKVVAKGTGITYQWQYRTSAKGTWKKAAATGNKTATLKVPVTATKNGFQYRCMITDKYGNVMYSKAVTLNVK